jgi:hypothetical protein
MAREPDEWEVTISQRPRWSSGQKADFHQVRMVCLQSWHWLAGDLGQIIPTSKLEG